MDEKIISIFSPYSGVIWKVKFIHSFFSFVSQYIFIVRRSFNENREC